jgi:hypothetical protein
MSEELGSDDEHLRRWVAGEIPDSEWITPDFSPEEMKRLKRMIEELEASQSAV